MANDKYKLTFIIDADGRTAKQELAAVAADVNKLGGRMTAIFGGAIPVAGALAAGVGAVATAAAGLGLAMFNITKTAAEFGSTIYDATQKTGLGATAISSLKVAAETSGASLENVTKGIARFAKDYKGTSSDLQSELGKVFKQIADAKPGFEQLTLAQKNFGKGGADLIPVIRSFDGDLDGLIKHMEELGVTIDDEAAIAADQFGDQMDILNAQLAGVGRTIGTALMPEFMAMASGISNWLTSNKSEIAEFAARTATVFSNLIHGFNTVKNWIDNNSTYLRIAAGFLTLGNSEVALAVGKGLVSFLDMVSTPRGAGRGTEGMGAAYVGRYNPDGDPGGTKAGKAIRPKVESDAEFRKFFSELGFNVVRTYGRAINAGSPHTYGGAADLSIRGKSSDEIFMLMVKSLEKGYRVFDERKPAPGVKQTGPHVHVENAKTSLMKESRFLGLGFSPDQVAYLRDLDQKRLGKASGKDGFESFVAKNTEAQQKAVSGILKSAREVLNEWLKAEKTGMDERLEIRRTEADMAEEILRGQLQQGTITEQEYIERVGQLRVDMLQDERDEIEKQLSTRETVQKIAVLDLKIATAKLEKENAIAVALEKQADALYKMGGTSAAGALGTLRDSRPADKQGSIFDDIDAATGKIRTFQDVLSGLGSTASDIFMQMGQGLGQMLSAWVMMGDQADVSMSKMVASVLAGVAAQAATLAVFHLAMGIVALTPWGAAMYGSPTNHFIAAAMWGGIAAGAAIGGRALAGNSGKGSVSGGASYSSGGSGSTSQANMSPMSRASSTAFFSGRDTSTDRLTRAIENFNAKVDAAKPGDVFIRGMKASRGAVGQQVVADIRTNARTGTDLGRSLGIR